jgi:hypothetical protein
LDVGFFCACFPTAEQIIDNVTKKRSRKWVENARIAVNGATTASLAATNGGKEMDPHVANIVWGGIPSINADNVTVSLKRRTNSTCICKYTDLAMLPVLFVVKRVSGQELTLSSTWSLVIVLHVRERTMLDSRYMNSPEDSKGCSHFLMTFQC